MKDHGLRSGDLVEVRSAAEILDTLDADGALDAMPFMPEMVPYCGRQFTVSRRADKVCCRRSASSGRRWFAERRSLRWIPRPTSD